MTDGDMLALAVVAAAPIGSRDIAAARSGKRRSSIPGEAEPAPNEGVPGAAKIMSDSHVHSIANYSKKSRLIPYRSQGEPFREKINVLVRERKILSFGSYPYDRNRPDAIS